MNAIFRIKTSTTTPTIEIKTRLKTLIFLRHGRTRYSQYFPDLTDEGRTDIKSAAMGILKLIPSDCSSVSMVSSPLPRTLGSAEIIADEIGFPFREVRIEPRLRCMDIYDHQRAQRLWEEFGETVADTDGAYRHHEIFETGEIVERRSVVQLRFGDYLEECFKTHLEFGNLPDFTIHTTHFEILWKLAMAVDLPQLVHGELVILHLNEKNNGVLPMEVRFRGKGRFLGVPANRLSEFWKLL